MPVTHGVAGSSPVQSAKICSLIAQLVEHLTVNQVVPGSSPGRGAKRIGKIDESFWVSFNVRLQWLF